MTTPNTQTSPTLLKPVKPVGIVGYGAYVPRYRMTTPQPQTSPTLLKPVKPVGIVGYGAYVPRYRLPAKEVARVWTGSKRSGLPIKEKAVPGLDEDVITMSIEAARNAMLRAQIDPTEMRAVWVGSESHPYAVKPTSTVVAEAIGAVPNTQGADLEFACKAGTEAMVAAMGMVGSGMGRYAMAIGMDTAQGKPGDALEYTAARGRRRVHPRSRRRVAGDHQLVVFLRHRHARFLAARISKVSRTRHALHGRTCLLQAHHRSRHASHGSQRHDRQGLQVGDLPSAEHKVPATVAGQLGFSMEQIDTWASRPL